MTAEFAFFPLNPALDVEARIPTIEQVADTDMSRSTWRIISDGLLSDEDPSQKASKITNNLRLLILDDLPYPDWDDIWWILVKSFCAIPPDHPWQTTLLEVVEEFSHLDKTQTGDKNKSNEYIIWRELPKFDVAVYEMFAYDPNDFNYYDEFRPDVADRWKNYTSFVARIGKNKACNWGDLPIWQLRTDLENDFPSKEETPYRAAMIELRIWTATEWILHHGKTIHRLMRWDGPLDKDDNKTFRLGPLLEGVEAYSLGRWNFWKERLRTLAGQLGDLGVDSAMAERISQTLERMDELEEDFEKQKKRKTRRKAKAEARSQAQRRAQRHSRRQGRK
ncbi:hypothetical protein B0T10DRAFT_493670 [Thelonectria olida]|uniref:Uncharacterized protein n=1 Tax=Thelonectria olida TaxID=1576542 RepID=A0A9P8VY91_9HYPO|nr:hypothetical protein B0T10DRAFT_493670 [Thelonectria olida]